MLPPKEYELAQKKKTRIPLWLIAIIIIYWVIKVANQSFTTQNDLETFKSNFLNSDLELSYEKFGELFDSYEVAPLSSGTLSNVQIDCLSQGDTFWEHMPSVKNKDTKQFFLKINASQTTLVLELRLYKDKVYFSPWKKAELGFNGGFSAKAKCPDAGFNKI
ncbi:hypothetical protein HII17_16370 [Thalassotalea sp. M1531]|uniref:Uncharacterized protein n=1 Tax=Thalassotalea algicola TaxID=2716224 RepID=A0A7Y0LEN6_9GAMM|nr:hypothetical protein [Thalassotalea algicola]NMP33135.1 hypothetical protein [Thalassotalea algicola]